MYVNDPFDLTVPPSIESNIEIEEPRDSKDFFWDDVVYWPDTVSYHQGLHTDICRFDEAGNHTQMSKKCPHFDPEDEEGRRITKGWTAQSSGN